MVKVLIYSSKELYDSSSFHARAEADLVAYSLDDHYYQVVKNRNPSLVYRWTMPNDFKLFGPIVKYKLKRHIARIEQDEWKRDLKAFELQEKYKDHPLTELDKNG